MTKSYLLSDLGKLRSGYSSRSRLDAKNDEEPTHYALSMRALHRENRRKIDWSQVDPIVFGKDRKKSINADNYILHDGDVLFSIRGLYLTAVQVKNPPPKTVVLNNWAILTPAEFIEGRYLVWWFNHSHTQHQIDDIARGSNQIFLPISELRQLKVPVPSLEIQKQIAELDDLRQREKELVQKLETKRNQRFEILTLNLLNRESEKEM